jgi:hypothetical protein
MPRLSPGNLLQLWESDYDEPTTFSTALPFPPDLVQSRRMCLWVGRTLVVSSYPVGYVVVTGSGWTSSVVRPRAWFRRACWNLRLPSLGSNENHRGA